MKTNRQTTDHSLSTALPPSRLLKVRDAHVAVAPFSLLNNSSPRAQCGTRSASAVLNVNAHWIQWLLATDQTRRFTAARATDVCSDQRASVMDTPQPCPPTENQPWTSKLLSSSHPNSFSCVNLFTSGLLELEALDQLTELAASDVDLPCTTPRECSAKAADGTNVASTAPTVTDPSTQPTCVMHQITKFTGKSTWAIFQRWFLRNFFHFSRNCYGRVFGPRGIGFGLGAGVLSTI